MKDAQSAELAGGWLILVYKMPSNPSTLRIGIWKRMRELGALLLQQSVYILPNRPRLKESIEEVKDRILKLGGQSRLLQTASFDDDQQKQMVNEFRLLTDQDYNQIIDDCHLLMRELERKSKAERLTLSEFEEIEKRLGKLRERFDAAADRDFFVSDRQAEVSRLMQAVADFLSFSNEVLCRDKKAADTEPGAVGPAGADERQSAKETTPVCSTDEVASRLKEVIEGLEGGTLKLGSRHLRMSGEPVGLTVEYRGGKRGKSLRIGVQWR